MCRLPNVLSYQQKNSSNKRRTQSGACRRNAIRCHWWPCIHGREQSQTSSKRPATPRAAAVSFSSVVAAAGAQLLASRRQAASMDAPMHPSNTWTGTK